MKPHLICLLVTLTVSACSSSGVSERALEGKRFRAKLDMPKAVGNDNPMGALMLAMMANMNARYAFKSDHQGTYSAEAGAMTTNQEFTWVIEGDTLKITPVNGSEAKNSHYFIQPEANGYVLKEGTVTLHLTEVE